MESATQVPMRVNLRQRRAQALAHRIFQMIEPLVEPEAVSGLLYKMQKLFEQEGAEVLTDYDRQTFGLPARGPDGWTTEEIIALERLRLAALYRPITQALDPSPSGKP